MSVAHDAEDFERMNAGDGLSREALYVREMLKLLLTGKQIGELAY